MEYTEWLIETGREQTEDSYFEWLDYKEWIQACGEDVWKSNTEREK